MPRWRWIFLTRPLPVKWANKSNTSLYLKLFERHHLPNWVMSFCLIRQTHDTNLLWNISSEKIVHLQAKVTDVGEGGK
jgi:hypothetical protein